MTKTEKTKNWIKNHRDGLTSAGIVAGMAVVYAGVIAFAVKVNNDETQKIVEQQQMLAEAATRGAQILPGPDDMYWIIEKN